MLKRSCYTDNEFVSYYNPSTKESLFLKEDTLQNYFNNNSKVNELLKENHTIITFKIKRRGL